MQTQMKKTTNQIPIQTITQQEICVKTGKSNKHQNQAKFQTISNNFKQFHKNN